MLDDDGCWHLVTILKNFSCLETLLPVWERRFRE